MRACRTAARLGGGPSAADTHARRAKLRGGTLGVGDAARGDRGDRRPARCRPAAPLGPARPWRGGPRFGASGVGCSGGRQETNAAAAIAAQMCRGRFRLSNPTRVRRHGCGGVGGFPRGRRSAPAAGGGTDAAQRVRADVGATSHLQAAASALFTGLVFFPTMNACAGSSGSGSRATRWPGARACPAVSAAKP